MARFLQATLRDAQGDLERRAAEVRRDDDDAVHQLRVLCRRLRSELRAFRSYYEPESTTGLRDQLGRLAASFDEARDLDVLRTRVQRNAVGEPWDPIDVDFLLAELTDQLGHARDAAIASLDGPDLTSVLAALPRLAGRPGGTALAEQQCSEVLPGLVAVAWKRATRACDRLDVQGEAERWHRARILAKQARYTAEAATRVVGRPALRVAKGSRRAQELLGEDRDASVAGQRLASLGASYRGAEAVVCGRLIEREQALRRQAQLTFLDSWPRIRSLADRP